MGPLSQNFVEVSSPGILTKMRVFGAQYFPNPRETKDLLQDFLGATQKSKFFGIVTPFHKQILDTASTQKKMKNLEKPVFYPSMWV